METNIALNIENVKKILNRHVCVRDAIPKM